MDPYVMTPAEKARFEQQFNALKPINGIVTGAQAKGFFLQSQLPPAILGIIWGLADTDADGRMNIHEFSIACKLISMKLRGFEIPKVLPPSMQMLVQGQVNGTHPGAPMKPPVPPQPVNAAMMSKPPVATVAPINRIISPPSGGGSPLSPPLHGDSQPPLIPTQSMMVTTQPMIQPMQPQQQSFIPTQPILQQQNLINSQSMIPMQTQQPLIPQQSTIPTQAVMPMQPVIPTQAVIPMQPMMPATGMQAAPAMPISSIQGPPSVPPLVPPPPASFMASSSPSHQLPVAPSPPLAIAPMAASPPPIAAFTAPQPAGVQPIAANAGAVPPNTLSGLNIAQPAPQPSAPPLEKIPSLDGSLSGSPLVEWAIPQTSRLKYTQLFNTTDRNRTGYLSGVQARNILLASQLPQAILAKIWSLADMDSDGRLSCEEFVLALHLCDMARRGEPVPSTLPPNLLPPTLRRQRNNSLSASDPDANLSGVSFEDRRKENFDKGQAELEKRRKALLEVQRREQEERERKEREEQERQDRVRMEQERKRQEELERQAERQKELERAKEEERRKLQEQKLAARREMERQRQEEWEKQRLLELHSQRQKQQEAVLQLKAKNQTLTIELTQLNEKALDLSKNISDTRCKVTSVKSTIDGMRLTRDETVANQNRLKAQLKQYNQQLVALSQQKAKLEAQGKKDLNSDEQLRVQTTNKEINIKNLRDKNSELEEVVKKKQVDLDNNNAQVDSLKLELIELIQNCQNMFSIYEAKRDKVLEKRGANKTSGWGDEAWDAAPSSWPETHEELPPPASGYARYRALYEFVARNSDELSFQPGDVIMVSTTSTGEPGWLSGEIRGDTGWFPESYVEPIDGSSAPVDDPAAINNFQTKTPLEGIAEVSESELEGLPPVPPYPDPILGLGQPVSQSATANHNFNATAASQLSLIKGDFITVSEIQDQWVYGEVNGGSGWFPKSFVTLNERVILGINDIAAAIPDPVAAPAEGGEWYVATYAYQSDEPGDLTFDQGQSVLVTGRDGDWWTGVIGNVSGIFPSNYVHKPDAQVIAEEIVPAVEPTPIPVVEQKVVSTTPVEVPLPTATVEPLKPATPVALEAEMTGGSSRAITPEVSSASPTPQQDIGSADEGETKKIKKPEIATVIAPYQASSSEQLNLQRGQLIMIRKKSSTGWWEGELQAKGRKRQVGWFPASYVKLLGGGTSSSQAKSPSPIPNRDSTGTDTNTEKVIALYQYTAQNEDELNFEKDDIITVIGRDEPAWWKGELNGAVGLFPSNYVGPVSNRLSLIDTNGNFSFVTKEEEKRQQHITELIDTEQAYIEDLSIVDNVFQKPMTESRILSTEQIRAIFINWHDILECNRTFLRSLRVRRGMSSNALIRMVGDILCENIPRMTIYIRFCSCQLNATALLQTLTESNKDFSALSRRCQSDPRTKGLPLSSFLIKPMQRITKYPLLISKILQQTPVDHPDRHYLDEALSRAEELCSQVNEGVREKENSERLEWLQSHILADNILTENLIFNSLTNSMGPRKLIHYGVISKRSGKELVAFLMNDFFLLAVPNRPLGQQFSFEKNNNVLFRIYKTPLLLSDLLISNSPEAANGVELKLEYDKKIYNLCALTHNERNLWFKKLHEAQTQLRLNEKAKFQRQQSIRRKVPKAMLCLTIIRATDLEHSKLHSAKREIFCELSMGSQENRTQAVCPPLGESPKWGTSMQFLVKDLQHDVLCITIKDKGHFSPDEFLGRTEIRVSEILKSSQNTQGPLNKVLKLHEVPSGEIQLKLDLRLFDK